VLLSIIELKWMIDGCALLHELYGAAGVSRYITDSEQTVWQLWATHAVQ